MACYSKQLVQSSFKMRSKGVIMLFMLITLLARSYAINIDGQQMSMEDAIIQAGASQSLSGVYEIMQDADVVRVELDMNFKLDKYIELRKEMQKAQDKEDVSSRQKRKAIIPLAYRWTNKRIPYEISYEFTASERQLIMEAIADYHRYTCVRFVPATASDTNKVRIVNGGGCSSFVGMIGGTQQLTLAPGCRYKGIIIHEMGHAVGFQHEQTRSDRDSFVSIATSNIQSGLEYNFMRYSESQVDNHDVPYDYSSVMHYSQYAFSRNGQPTIRARDSRYQEVMGNRDGLSFNDIRLANAMYKCAEENQCQARQCPLGAFQGPDCKCWCDSGDRANPVVECGSTGSVTRVTGQETVPPATTSRPTACSDNHEYCPNWARSGYCSGNYETYMKSNCKLSCNYCSSVTTTSTTMATPPIANCVDESTFCSVWAKAGECSRNPSYMRQFCKRSCNACTGLTTVASCRDVNSNCEKWKQYCTNDVYASYLKGNCARTCRYCSASDATVTTTPSTTTETIREGCMDSYDRSYCSSRKEQCQSSLVSARCRKSCQLC